MPDNHRMDHKSLGKRLKAARIAAELTQLNVAIRLGLARSSVSMIENGSRSLRVGELEALAAQYRVQPDSLMSGLCDKSKNS